MFIYINNIKYQNGISRQETGSIGWNCSLHISYYPHHTICSKFNNSPGNLSIGIISHERKII